MNRYLCCFNCFSLQGSKKIEINLDELTNLRVSEIKKFIPPINNGKVIRRDAPTKWIIKNV